MADFVYNISLGKGAEYAARVNANDPTNAVLGATVIDTTATDATLRDLDTLALVIADGNTTERASNGWTRETFDQAAGITVTVDDTNDRTDVDMPDITYTSVLSSNDATDIVFWYDSDSTGGTDANIVPMTQHDFAVTTDGSDVTAQLNASGFYRATAT